VARPEVRSRKSEVRRKTACSAGFTSNLAALPFRCLTPLEASVRHRTLRYKTHADVREAVKKSRLCGLKINLFGFSRLPESRRLSAQQAAEPQESGNQRFFPTFPAVGKGTSTRDSLSPIRASIRLRLSPLPGLPRYSESAHPTTSAVGHMTAPAVRASPS